MVTDEDGWKTNLISHGVPFALRSQYSRTNIDWRRPAKEKTDKSRRLLATGRYEDEEERVPRFVAPDPERGFPQPFTPWTAAVDGNDKDTGKNKKRKRADSDDRGDNRDDDDHDGHSKLANKDAPSDEGHGTSGGMPLSATA